MSEKFTVFDPAEGLRSEEGIRVFLADALETGNAGYITHALGIVARARGMTQLAQETGISREHLYRAFSEDGNPTLKTLLAVMNVLHMSLTATTDAPKAKRSPRKRVTRAAARKSAARAAH